MSKDVLKRIGGLVTIVVLVGVGLLASVTSAIASTTAAPATVVDLNGSWTDFGAAKPSISVGADGSITIDMSYAGRPNAYGNVANASTIYVTFPDAGTYRGTLYPSSSGHLSDEIVWNNNTSWLKVYTGSLLFPLSGNWDSNWGGNQATLYDSGVYGSGGYLEVSIYGRPPGVGFSFSASGIYLYFPDDAAYIGTLQAPDYINWSNGSTWTLAVLR